MRNLQFTTAIGVAIFIAPAMVVGQAPATGLSITNYQLVSEERLTRTESNFTYRADLVNSGAARTSVTATLTSTVPSVQVVNGRGTLRFAPVPANSQTPSTDTFTIKVDRTVPFDFAKLHWEFTLPAAPVANAGPNQTVPVGATATLNGSGSTNPSGSGTLTYQWAFVSRPAGSSATLTNANSVASTFVVDVPGSYVINLTVSNGSLSDTDSVTVSTSNSAPVAKAGPNQTVNVGSTVTLNGSGSSDIDGDPLTFSWALTSKPAGSAAALSGANTVAPTFVADKPGTYMARLIVNDGALNSAASTVTITTQNSAPVARAGTAQKVNVGVSVQLNGSGSTDVDGDPLTYRWSLTTLPAGSTATLSSTTAVNPTFTVDRPGTYVAQLIVNDGKVDSAPSTVTITTNAVQAPTANAGPNQTVKHGSTVTLDGSGTDPQSLPLTLQWSLTTKPSGSTATLTGPTTAHPTFVADRPGDYVAQLIVNNGFLNSVADTVTITTTNTAPVARAGNAQNATVGVIVTLDGSGSSDADGDALTYSWTFNSRPQGSTAALSAAASPKPTFVPDVAGTYVAQLIVNDGFAASTPSTVTITAVAPLAITTTSLPDGSIGDAYSKILAATGGKGPYTWSLITGVLPAGLTFTAATAEIKGTPTALATNTPLKFQVTDSSSPVKTATADLKLTITVGDPASITATAGTPQSAKINTAFTTALTAVVKDAGGNAVSGATVTFTVPASGASCALTGGATATTNASGVATKTCTANGSLGTYNVTASVAGVATPATFALTNTPGPPASITATAGSSQSALVNTAFTTALTATVKDSGGNPVSGVTVTFAAPGTGPSCVLAGGATGTTNASGVVTKTCTANTTAGPFSVTASVAGVATPATFNLTNNPGPAATITATGGTPQNATIGTAFAQKLAATVKDSFGNLVPNVTVTFTPPSSGASGTFAGGNTAVTSAAGVATSNIFTANTNTGSYQVNASAPGVAQAANFALTNTPISGGQVTLTGANIGKGLQKAITLTLPQAAPAGGLPVSMTVSNANLIKLAGNSISAGSPSLQFTVLEGQTSVFGIYVQAFANSGSATVTATTAFGNATSTITLSPSAFVLAGPNGAGVVSMTTSQGTTTPVTVTPARLDSTLKFAEAQQVAGGSSVTVDITNSNSQVGTIAPAAVTLQGGDIGANINFTAALSGSTTLTASVPAGFSTPAALVNTLTVQVTPAAISIDPVTVGQNLQTTSKIKLFGAAPSSGVTATVTSSDDNKMLLSLTPTGAGSHSITFEIQGGRTASQEFYVFGRAGSGTASIMATAQGLGSATGTVTLRPAGFIIAGPFGIGTDFSTTSSAANSDIEVIAVMLDASGLPVEEQPVRGGLTANVPVTSSKPAVGSITTSPVAVAGGSSRGTTQFDPASEGDSVLQAGPPAGGFVMPSQSATLTAHVIQPAARINVSPLIGRNLQASATLLLGEPAPPGGVNVTITADPNQLRPSLSPTTAGSATGSIVINVPAGESSATFYFQARAGSGNANYSASAPGYKTGTGSLQLVPSAVLVGGLLGPGFQITTTVNAGPQILLLSTYALDPSNNAPIEPQAVAGGANLSVVLTSSVAGVVNVSSPVVIASGESDGTGQFTPQGAGQTNITVTQPLGFTSPSSGGAVVVKVNP